MSQRMGTGKMSRSRRADLARMQPGLNVSPVRHYFSNHRSFVLIFIVDKRGWAWCIPLHNGKTSIGVVMHQETSNQKKAAGPKGLEAHYLDQVKLAPGVHKRLGNNASYITGSVRSTADFSYHAKSYSGDHYRIIGDAAGTALDHLVISHVSHQDSICRPAFLIGSAHWDDRCFVCCVHYPWLYERTSHRSGSVCLA